MALKEEKTSHFFKHMKVKKIKHKIIFKIINEIIFTADFEGSG
jgi:hypothetical protein